MGILVKQKLLSLHEESLDIKVPVRELSLLLKLFSSFKNMFVLWREYIDV